MKKCIDFFNRAIAADPNYALAYAGLAEGYSLLSRYTDFPEAQARLLADQTSRKALELDDSLADSHRARAIALVNAFRFGESEPEFKRALELNPNDANAHYFYGFGFLLAQNRIDQALRELRTTLALDPLSPAANFNYGVLLTIARQYSEAEAHLKKVIETNPSYPQFHFYLSQLYAVTGRYQDAIQEMQKSIQLEQKGSSITGAFSADAKGFNRLMLTANSKYGEDTAGTALSYALLGDSDKMFEYLEKSYVRDPGDFIQTLRNPALDPFRSDPRYKELMRRLQIPE